MRLLVGVVLAAGGLTLAAPLLETFADKGLPVGAVSQALPEPVVSSAARPEAIAEGTLYRWRDSKGTVHIGTTAPQKTANVAVIRFSRSEPEPRSPADAPATPPPRAGGGLADNPLRVYTPEGAEEILRRVDQTLEIYEQRRQSLEQAKKQL